jgi:hypothetical protein
MLIPHTTTFWVDSIVSNRSNQEIGPVSLSHERIGSALTHRSHELIPVLPLPPSISKHSHSPIPSVGPVSLFLFSSMILILRRNRQQSSN